MKIRHFFLFVAVWLLVLAPAWAAEAPKLETLLGEYKKARADVIHKLNEAYASQSDTLAQQYQSLPNLDGADRAREFSKLLREADGSKEVRGFSSTPATADPLAVLQANYTEALQVNLGNVYTFYSTTAENLRRELLRTKDQAGAAVLTTFLDKIKVKGQPVAVQASPVNKRKTPGK